MYERSRVRQHTHLGRIVEDFVAMLQDCGLSLLQQRVPLWDRHGDPVAHKGKLRCMTMGPKYENYYLSAYHRTGSGPIIGPFSEGLKEC